MSEQVAELLAGHGPVPVFGCECMPTDPETGVTETLEVAWEQHVAEVIEPVIAERVRAAREDWTAV